MEVERNTKLMVTADLPNSLLKDGDTVPGDWLRRRSLLGPAAARRHPLTPGQGSTRVREMQGYSLRFSWTQYLGLGFSMSFMELNEFLVTISRDEGVSV